MSDTNPAIESKQVSTRTAYKLDRNYRLTVSERVDTDDEIFEDDRQIYLSKGFGNIGIEFKGKEEALLILRQAYEVIAAVVEDMEEK